MCIKPVFYVLLLTKKRDLQRIYLSKNMMLEMRSSDYLLCKNLTPNDKKLSHLAN